MAPFNPYDPWQEMRDQARWDDSAACRNTDEPELWDTYRVQGKTVVNDAVRKAVEICVECPVMLDCLTHGIIYKSEYTIRGGMTDEERARYVTTLRQRRSLKAVS